MPKQEEVCRVSEDELRHDEKQLELEDEGIDPDEWAGIIEHAMSGADGAEVPFNLAKLFNEQEVVEVITDILSFDWSKKPKDAKVDELLIGQRLASNFARIIEEKARQHYTGNPLTIYKR